MTADELRAALTKLYGEGSDYHLAESAAAHLGTSKSSVYAVLSGKPVQPKVSLETVLRIMGVLSPAPGDGPAIS
jgi:predicted DNA-binding protein (MmcQ/YjbR family)